LSHCQACNKTVEQTEKDVQLEKLFAKYRGQKGALIPVLQKAQDIYGYLPKEVLEKISSELKLPPAKVYGVVTFYSQFHLEPRGKYVIRVCQGTACHVRGASKIFEELQNLLQIKDGETTKDLKFTLESVACLGACGLAPVIMINDDTHGRLTKESIAKILAQYE
jgi:NADH-quinone oxidoreductase subunit E